MSYEENFNKSGLIVIEPKVFPDSRGYFFESFNKKKYENLIGNIDFVQDNESCSSKGVLRGLHYQAGEFAQAKLVRVIKGSVVDFALDIRKSSPTFGKLFSMLLSEKNKKQFFIPRGFAHGFYTIENDTIFSYKCDNYWNKESERGIFILNYDIRSILTKYHDTAMEVHLKLSEKDKDHPDFKNALDLFD